MHSPGECLGLVWGEMAGGCMPAAPGVAECRRRAGEHPWGRRGLVLQVLEVCWRAGGVAERIPVGCGGLCGAQRGMLCSLPGKPGHLCCPQPSLVRGAAMAARGSRPFSGVRQNQTNLFEGCWCGAGGLASQQCWWLCFWGSLTADPADRRGVGDPRGRQSSRTACKPTARGCLLSCTSRRGAW